MARRLIGVPLLALALAACGGGDDPAGPVPVDNDLERIAGFDFLLGTWTVTSRFTGADGTVEAQAVSVISSSLEGRVHKERWVGTREGHTVEVLSLYGRSNRAGQWLVVRGDGDRGTLDILEGSFAGTRATFTTRAGTRPDGGRERVSFDSLREDRFVRIVERSTDAGSTWTPYWTMEYRRAPSGTAQPAAPVPAPGCTDPRYHEFDFWVGDWSIGGARNTIPARLGGCIVEENWVGSERGTSFNMYDPRSDLWTQVWIDDIDNTLFLQGGLQGEQMVMVEPGDRPANRITWTPLSAGRVRQHGELSTDGGTTWTTNYDLTYVPRGVPAR